MGMLVSTSFWWAAGTITLAVWLAMVAIAAYNKSHILCLEPDARTETAGPLISVIVPARNEAADIAAALHSLLAQQGVRLEIVAVNDHSSDATGRLMDEVAGSDARLTVIHNPYLEPGWLGKANAMRAGLERARGKIILFTDADVIHHPRCCVTALAEMERTHSDLISGLPQIDLHLFWEHAMLPMFVAGLGKLVPEKRQQDKRCRAAAASGALMLIKRQTLRAIGDLQAVKGSLADDMTLARELKRQGFKVGYRLAPALMKLRLFKGNREAFVSTSKNILLVIEESLWLSPFVPLFTFLLFWAPLIMVGLGIGRDEPLLAIAGLAFYLTSYAGLFVCRPIFSFRPLPALAFPLVLLVAGYCISRAAILHLRGKIVWRGRIVRVR